ncbi:E3 ubiquitin-protein ligase RNF4 isoform X2 [Monomorium pharaonis]|nr:E3 ubiquitin-protein ligase RNF4 isoform X2 [Monomorium pharaonis]
MIHLRIYEYMDMDDTDDSLLDVDHESLLDDSVVHISPPTVIDVIDLTKETPRSLTQSSRLHPRNAEDVSSSHNVTSSSDRRHRRPLSPIVFGSAHRQDTHMKNPRKEKRVPYATSSNEVFTLDDTGEEANKTTYTVEFNDKGPVPLTCPICFESLSSDRKPLTTRCGHVFCTECLQTNFHTSKKCPTCKSTITLKSCTRLYF